MTYKNEFDVDNSEYCAKVQWYNINPNPLWIPRDNNAFYAPVNTVAIMYRDATIRALQKHFDVFFDIQ